MAEQNPMGCAECGPTQYAVEDAENQRVVLSFILEEHPAQMTIPEVAQALYAHPGDFEQSDAVERAIRDLIGGGLLHCHGAFVLTTRAALYFARLKAD